MDSIKQRETWRNCRMVIHGGQIIIAFLMTLLFFTPFTRRMYDYSKTLETPICFSLPKYCRFWNSYFIDKLSKMLLFISYIDFYVTIKCRFRKDNSTSNESAKGALGESGLNLVLNLSAQFRHLFGEANNA